MAQALFEGLAYNDNKNAIWENCLGFCIAG
jgi:hypothetical protein